MAGDRALSADGHVTDFSVRAACGRAPAPQLAEIDEYADLFASWTGGMVCRDCLVAVAPGFSR